MTEPGRPSGTDSDADRTQTLSTVDLDGSDEGTDGQALGGAGAPGAASAEASWQGSNDPAPVEMSTTRYEDASVAPAVADVAADQAAAVHGHAAADHGDAAAGPGDAAPDHSDAVADVADAAPDELDAPPAPDADLVAQVSALAAQHAADAADAPQEPPTAPSTSSGLPLVTPASRAGLPPAGARSVPRAVPVNPLGSRSSAGGRSPAGGNRPAAPRSRRARLRLRRIDPLSVFLLSLVISLFLAIVLVVAVVALYAALTAAGVPGTINDLVGEVTRASTADAAEPAPLLTASRVVTAAGVVAAVDVVLLTVLSTLGALLYNVCASFTGGIEVTLAEPEDR